MITRFKLTLLFLTQHSTWAFVQVGTFFLDELQVVKVEVEGVCRGGGWAGGEIGSAVG